MADNSELTVRDNPAERRYEARLEGEVVGYSQYIPATDRIIFTHTVVEPEYEGRGIGTELARAVVEDAIARGLRITPRCPFIRAYLQRHRQYDDLVDYPPTQPTA